MLWERSNELATFFILLMGCMFKFLSVYYNYVNKEGNKGEITVCSTLRWMRRIFLVQSRLIYCL